jgi:hypothetical protein
MLYSFVEVNNKNILLPQETSLLLSWDMSKIFDILGRIDDQKSEAVRLSLNISNLTLFGSQSKQSEPPIPNCLINFNPQMTK